MWSWRRGAGGIQIRAGRAGHRTAGTCRQNSVERKERSAVAILADTALVQQLSYTGTGGRNRVSAPVYAAAIFSRQVYI